MRIYLLRGIPGSGKSTWVEEYKRAFLEEKQVGRVEVFSADDYFRVNGIFKFEGWHLEKAHRSCLRLYMDDLRSRGPDVGGTCIVDNTNIGIADLAPYVAIGEALGFDQRLKIMQFHNNPQKAKNVHGVPAATVERMAQNLKPLPRRWQQYEEVVPWTP